MQIINSSQPSNPGPLSAASWMALSPLSPHGRFLKRLGPQMAQFLRRIGWPIMVSSSYSNVFGSEIVSGPPSTAAASPCPAVADLLAFDCLDAAAAAAAAAAVPFNCILTLPRILLLLLSFVSFHATYTIFNFVLSPPIIYLLTSDFSPNLKSETEIC